MNGPFDSCPEKRGAPLGSQGRPRVARGLRSADHGVNVMPSPFDRLAPVPHEPPTLSRNQVWKYHVLPGRITLPDLATGCVNTAVPVLLDNWGTKRFEAVTQSRPS